MNEQIEEPLPVFMLLAGMALVSVAASILVFLSVPNVPDFYNLVYENSRPARGENTLIFFAIFPLFQLIVLGTVAFRLYVDQQVPIKHGLLGFIGSTIFFLINMYRCMYAWSFFH